MTEARFTADTITINSKTFPAQYSVSPSNTVFVLVTVEEDGKPISLRIKIDPADPNHSEAFAAAQSAEPEEPARDPKQARGLVPEKTFVGDEIAGNGWRIVFDGEAQRTRVIFDRNPGKAVRETVKNAGFYWLPSYQSWNKKLTFRAYRAAQTLAAELENICG